MAKPRKVIVACMRNEALFLVEWIAHHMAAGFTHFVIYTNDCDDGTDQILDLLAGHFPIKRFDNPGPYPAGTIQKQALRRAFRLPLVREADWVLHIDADEYVNVVTRGRRIDDLIALHPQADGIALMWRHFGNAGQAEWAGGSVIETFPWCERKVPDVTAGQIAGFKTLFRPARFREISIHTPKHPVEGVTPQIVNTEGVAMPLDAVLRRRGSGYAVGPEHLTWANARLHHHHVKSDDLHLMKHARGDANGRNNAKRLIGSDYYRAANRNEARDHSLLRFRPTVQRVEAQLRAVPGVVDAEVQALAWFRAQWQALRHVAE